MKTKTLLVSVCVTALAATLNAADPIQNPLIDYKKFQHIVETSANEREAHRLTEAQFLAAMQEPKVIILDARTDRWFAMRHIKGAVNLPFTDFTESSLAKAIPSKDSKVLIYCNNNFEGNRMEFMTKAPSASLNIMTYTNLKAYGYTNIFELGPLLNVDATKIPFEGSQLK